MHIISYLKLEEPVPSTINDSLNWNNTQLITLKREIYVAFQNRRDVWPALFMTQTHVPHSNIHFPFHSLSLCLCLAESKFN